MGHGRIGAHTSGFSVGCVVIGVILGSAPPITAQSTPSPSAWHAWSVAITGGEPLPGMGGDIEAMLDEAGFGELRPSICLLFEILCVAPQQYPVSTRGGGWSARIGYRHSRRVELALVAGAARGETRGYNGGGFGGTLLYVMHGLRLIAPTAHFRAGPLSAGGGPALYRLHATARHSESATSAADAVRLGVLVDVGLRFGLWRALFLEARYERRIAGAFEAGPWIAGGAAVPRSNVNLDHGYLGLGMGLEFR